MMRSSPCVLMAVAALLGAVAIMGCAVAAKPAPLPREGKVHEVEWLPGWAGALPSRIFSGYTPAGTPPG